MESLKDNGKPTIVRTEIDPRLFVKKLKCSYLDIPNNRIREVQKMLHDEMVVMPKFKPLIPIEGSTDKKRLLIQRFEEDNDKYEKVTKFSND